MNKLRSLSCQFKLEAVNKVLVNGLSYAQVARDLGIWDNILRNCIKAYQLDGTVNQDPVLNLNTKAELRRLREENRQLRIKRDRLIKATVYFANATT
jgi:transposase